MEVHFSAVERVSTEGIEFVVEIVTIIIWLLLQEHRSTVCPRGERGLLCLAAQVFDPKL